MSLYILARPSQWCSSRMNPPYPYLSLSDGHSLGRMCVCTSTRSIGLPVLAPFDSSAARSSDAALASASAVAEPGGGAFTTSSTFSLAMACGSYVAWGVAALGGAKERTAEDPKLRQ